MNEAIAELRAATGALVKLAIVEPFERLLDRLLGWMVRE